MIMVDSGHQHTDGWVDFYNVYKSMVDAELARPPQADITAVQRRVGSRLQFDVTVKNRSGVTLASQVNGASVYVLVYEDAKVGVTSRYVRAAPVVLISELANNAVETYHLETEDLSGVDWSKLHAVAIVDYLPTANVPRPEYGNPADMLQAAFAVESYFHASPERMSFLIHADHPVNKQLTLTLSGAPAGMTWTVTESIPWLAVTPSSGLVGQTAVVQVDAAQLPFGVEQYGSLHVAVTGSGFSYQQDISITAFKGALEEQYLPLVMR